MGRQVLRLVAWTLGWTVFQWWAVIGWPETLEGRRTLLVLISLGSSVGLACWYGVQRIRYEPRADG